MSTIAATRISPKTGRIQHALYNPAARFVLARVIDFDGTPHFSGFRSKPLSPAEWLAGRVERGWTPCPAPFKIAARVPGLRSLRHWSFDGVARATDGCKIEPDGHCHHGAPSWLVALGVI